MGKSDGDGCAEEEEEDKKTEEARLVREGIIERRGAQSDYLEATSQKHERYKKV